MGFKVAGEQQLAQAGADQLERDRSEPDGTSTPEAKEAAAAKCSFSDDEQPLGRRAPHSMGIRRHGGIASKQAYSSWQGPVQAVPPMCLVPSSNGKQFYHQHMPLLGSGKQSNFGAGFGQGFGPQTERVLSNGVHMQHMSSAQQQQPGASSSCQSSKLARQSSSHSSSDDLGARSTHSRGSNGSSNGGISIGSRLAPDQPNAPRSSRGINSNSAINAGRDVALRPQQQQQAQQFGGPAKQLDHQPHSTELVRDQNPRGNTGGTWGGSAVPQQKQKQQQPGAQQEMLEAAAGRDVGKQQAQGGRHQQQQHSSSHVPGTAGDSRASTRGVGSSGYANDVSGPRTASGVMQRPKQLMLPDEEDLLSDVATPAGKSKQQPSASGGNNSSIPPQQLLYHQQVLRAAGAHILSSTGSGSNGGSNGGNCMQQVPGQPESLKAPVATSSGPSAGPANLNSNVSAKAGRQQGAGSSYEAPNSERQQGPPSTSRSAGPVPKQPVPPGGCSTPPPCPPGSGSYSGLPLPSAIAGQQAPAGGWLPAPPPPPPPPPPRRQQQVLMLPSQDIRKAPGTLVPLAGGSGGVRSMGVVSGSTSSPVAAVPATPSGSTTTTTTTITTVSSSNNSSSVSTAGPLSLSRDAGLVPPAALGNAHVRNSQQQQLHAQMLPASSGLHPHVQQQRPSPPLPVSSAQQQVAGSMKVPSHSHQSSAQGDVQQRRNSPQQQQTPQHATTLIAPSMGLEQQRVYGLSGPTAGSTSGSGGYGGASVIFGLSAMSRPSRGSRGSGAMLSSSSSSSSASVHQRHSSAPPAAGLSEGNGSGATAEPKVAGGSSVGGRPVGSSGSSTSGSSSSSSRPLPLGQHAKSWNTKQQQGSPTQHSEPPGGLIQLETVGPEAPAGPAGTAQLPVASRTSRLLSVDATLDTRGAAAGRDCGGQVSNGAGAAGIEVADGSHRVASTAAMGIGFASTGKTAPAAALAAGGQVVAVSEVAEVPGGSGAAAAAAAAPPPTASTAVQAAATRASPVVIASCLPEDEDDLLGITPSSSGSARSNASNNVQMPGPAAAPCEVISTAQAATLHFQYPQQHGLAQPPPPPPKGLRRSSCDATGTDGSDAAVPGSRMHRSSSSSGCAAGGGQVGHMDINKHPGMMIRGSQMTAPAYAGVNAGLQGRVLVPGPNGGMPVWCPYPGGGVAPPHPASPGPVLGMPGGSGGSAGGQGQHPMAVQGPMAAVASGAMKQQQQPGSVGPQSSPMAMGVGGSVSAGLDSPQVLALHAQQLQYGGLPLQQQMVKAPPSKRLEIVDPRRKSSCSELCEAAAAK